MVPLATNGTVGKISNGTIGRIPNARDIYDLSVVSETCLVHRLLMVLKSDTVISISEFSILYLKLRQHAYAFQGCKMIIFR